MSLTTTKIANLIQLTDFDRTMVDAIVDRAFRFKEAHDKGVRSESLLNGRNVALIFEKPSLRTRCAFELGTLYLGGNPVVLSSQQIFASGNNERGRESIPDIARNLHRFVDIVLARVYETQTLNDIARVIDTPVVNLLCNRYHPTQALADLMTIRWHKGEDFKNIKLAYVGDGNNVAISLMQLAAQTGMSFSIASPVNYEIPVAERSNVKSLAQMTGADLEFVENPHEAVKDADVVYTDTFISMGEEHLKYAKLQEFSIYQVNDHLLASAKKDAIFMHCLPAHRGEEVTDDVLDGKQSVVFDQAECRMHIAKALLNHYLGEQLS